jgi:hypothetical protein
MGWFERGDVDLAERRRSGRDARFIDGLIDTLDDVRPAQVLAEETALTGEGPGCLIAIIPHRCLGGISLVVWLLDDAALVSWAQVGALWCCHDSLDLGVPIERVRLTPDDDFQRLFVRIREQLSVPLILRIYDDNRADVLARDATGRLKRIGELGQPPTWRQRWRRRQLAPDVTIRMTDVAPPPLTESPRVAGWFTRPDLG